MHNYPHRISRLQQKLSPKTALLIADRYDLLYLTGFIALTPDEREAFLLITPDSAIFWSAAFSPHQVESVTCFNMGIIKGFENQVLPVLEQESITTLSFYSPALRFSEFEWFKKSLPEKITLSSTPSSRVQDDRMIKDNTEIQLIQKANQLTHQVVNKVLKDLQAGQTEIEIKEQLESALRQNGVTEMAFPTIVAIGNHSAIPHHQPSSAGLSRAELGNLSVTLVENTPILIDIGAKWENYCADTTRTIWFGDSPDPEFLKVEKIIKKAYADTLQRCNAATSQRLTAAQIDKAARSIISQAGYGSQFIHTTGHGVGLYIHEQPSLNAKNETALKPGMVITIEPGIYLPGKFGYRYENSVVVTKDGGHEL